MARIETGNSKTGMQKLREKKVGSTAKMTGEKIRAHVTCYLWIYIDFNMEQFC